jgi:hypothetical protein
MKTGEASYCPYCTGTILYIIDKIDLKTCSNTFKND